MTALKCAFKKISLKQTGKYATLSVFFFTCGCVSSIKTPIKAFYKTLKPKLQKIGFFSKINIYNVRYFDSFALLLSMGKGTG